VGSVFRVSPEGVVSSVVSFNGTNGYIPRALMLATDGNFYGMTGGGGPTYVGGHGGDPGPGTIFRLTPDGTLTSVFAFDGVNGKYPYAGLLQASDGNFYGMTAEGGRNDNGTIFRLSLPLRPVLREVTRTNGTTCLTWCSVAGQSYQVQYSTSLSQTNWLNLSSPCTATNGVTTFLDTAEAEAVRVYRVMVLQ
jgi:uncharacterized repeat protein (TIGR03803 family)